MKEESLQALYPPADTKVYLSKVKKVIEDVKAVTDQSEKDAALCFLVSVYLDCPARTPVQRVLASFFEGLARPHKEQLEKWLCEKLLDRLSNYKATGELSAQQMRHTVDTVAALLENFKLGEKCVTSVAFHVVLFLVKAEEFFLPQVNADVPPVRLNEVMHHCHVTLQTLNLVLQKTVAGSTPLTQQLRTDPSQLLLKMFQIDLHILQSELFLLDCRCCSTMNALTLIKLDIGKEQGSTLIPSLILPNHGSTKESDMARPSWLTEDMSRRLDLEQQSVLAFLALAYGYIATMEPSEALKHTDSGKYFFVDLFLSRLLQHGLRCTDTISKALYGKTVNLFTTKLLSSIQTMSLSEREAADLSGESPALQRLLEYVWTHWEDQLDVIRQSAKTVFENVLKIHTTVAPATHSQKDPFLGSLLQHLFTVSWTSRGKFSALTSCVRLVGARTVLTMRSELPTEVVQQLQEQALSCYSSELYSALVTQHLQELSASSPHDGGDGETGKAQKETQDLGKSKNVPDKSAVNTLNKLQEERRSLFLQTWMLPVVRALSSSDKKLKQNIIEYLLPRILKIGDQVLSYMMQRLSSNHAEEEGGLRALHHGAVITCLRRARVMGLLKSTPQTEDSGSLWCGQVDPCVLRSALGSLDEQIRLDAFALVIENHKTAEVISSFEFDMVKFFLPSNLNNQSPAFRQSVVALMKKFFFRVKESLGALTRVLKKSNKPSPAHTSRQNYQDFLEWLSRHLLSCLYPGSAFAHRTSCLAVLSLMTSFFATESDGFSLPAFLSGPHIQTLIDCFSDTFEENKKEALRILTAYMAQVAPVWSKQQLGEVLEISMTLACSTRPQDCATAAYFFLTMMRQQQTYPDTCHFHTLLPTLSRLWISSSVSPPALTLATSQPLFLLPALISLLDDQISVAQQSLITAAANRPMYPTLHCIRFLLQEVNFSSLTPEALPSVKEFIGSLIHSCLNLSKVVSPVVQNSSPEGNVPEDAILGPGLNVGGALPAGEDSDKSAGQDSAPLPNMAQSVELSRALVESMPEYLVVCCWRSIKEVSLTLGKMCLQIPVSLIAEKVGNKSSSLLNLDQVLTVGDHFTQQLLESIHRGAFELAYAGFQLLCQMLWSHPEPAFHQLPGQWLSQVMKDIKSKDPNSRLCATRRSAGVPFFVQAITSSEPSSTGRKCFHSVMAELLAAAIPVSQDNEEAENNDAQVHALNILRALFKDARLGEDVVPYVADGLKAAVLGFKSDQWAVRNSATLLLSALMTRMFGVKRSKDETAMSKKNCQTGRLFFHRYPSLYPFLLSELEAATANVGSSSGLHLHPSLYPVLLVLGRLFPSTLEGSDTSLSLSAFIPYVLKCAASPVLKTRLIAARALRPLAKKNQVIDISSRLVDNLPVSQGSQTQTSSYIHGSLLQLVELISLVKNFNQTLRCDIVTSLVPLFADRLWIISSDNKCFTTRQAGLDLIDSLLEVTKSLPTTVPSLHRLQRHFFQALSIDDSTSAPNSVGQLQQLSWQPWFYEYQRTQARLYLKYLSVSKPSETFASTSEQNLVQCDVSKGEKLSIETTVSGIKSFLSSSFYEIRLEVLETLLGVLTNLKSAQTGSGDIDNVGKRDGSAEDDLPGEEPGQGEGWSGDLEAGQTRQVVVTGWTGEETRQLCRDLSDLLLDMAVNRETHHRCLEKVFLVLASIPDVTDFISRQNCEKNIQVFSILLMKLEAERRTEVKAAILMFSSSMIPFIHAQSTKGDSSESLDLLGQWMRVLQRGCAEEESTDFQIAGCHALLCNAERLLGHTLENTRSLTFQCWDILATLLQEDDLEVKDRAANVLCAVAGVESGSYHPSQALHLLPSILLSLHGAHHLVTVVKSLLTWILADSDVDVKDSSERLFDKGEMNTYWDQVAFSRSITACLAKLLDIDVEDKNSFVHTIPDASATITCVQPPGQISQLLEDSDITEFFSHSASNLVREFGVLASKCQKSDRYLNPARYTSLCQIVFRARVLLFLMARFTQEDCSNSQIQEARLRLNGVVQGSVQTFQLANILCGSLS